jgi:large subunit ribosomal protein L17
MRHLNGVKKLGRAGAHRHAMLRNLATELFRHERIETTVARAKVVRSVADKLITLGKRGDLHARRLAARDVQDHEILQKLFGEIAERFKDRAGGYTRVLHKGVRHGDCADMALIELSDYKAKVAEPVPEKKADKGGDKTADKKAEKKSSKKSEKVATEAK